MVLTIREIMFVYNEVSSPISMVMGFAHRLVSPETYECRLCDLTYNRFTMKAEWRTFLDRIGIPATFHFRNKFVASHPLRSGDPFPMILYAGDSGEPTTLLTADEINATTTLAQLEAAVTEKLALVRGA